MRKVPIFIKDLYLNTYKKRLSPAIIVRSYGDIFHLKMELWISRNMKMRSVKTEKWSLSQLETSLKRLKNNKTKDPHGMINELLKEGYLGFDLKSALVLLLNEVKEHMKIPDFMKWANITSIFKRKGR